VRLPLMKRVVLESNVDVPANGNGNELKGQVEHGTQQYNENL